MALTFAIVVVSHPVSHQGSLSAYQFTKAVLASEHRIEQIFFYGDGVCHGNQFSVIPQDETNIAQLWQQLAQEYCLALSLCSGSALRRGLLDDAEAQRHQHQSGTLLAPFALTGLGELAEAYRQADRVLVFGV